MNEQTTGILLLVLFLLSFHLLDIGGIALIKGGYLSNGFWNADANQVYHVGLYGMAISFFVIYALFWNKQQVIK